MPTSNIAYWTAKFARNQERDKTQVAALRALGWRVLIVWECALKPSALNDTADRAAKWLRSKRGSVFVLEANGRGS